MFTSSIVFLIIIGFSSIITQVLLLRELLVNFQGNELTLGIILGNWVIAGSLGAYLARRIKNERYGLLLILQFIFAAILPLSIYFCRISKAAFAIPIGQGVSLCFIFLISLLTVLPLAVSRGALFSACASTFGSVARVYTAEVSGMILGGITATYLFIPHLNSFQIAFGLALINLLACWPFVKRLRHSWQVFMFISIACIALAWMGDIPMRMQNASLAMQWKSGHILENRNSVYANITVLNKEKQTTFFYNGAPLITAPQPDITFTEEFGNLPLLFHSQPKKVLVIAGGAGGLINEILKHNIERIDYAELDYELIRLLLKYPSAVIDNELKNKRVRIISEDGQSFLIATNERYDCIIVGISNPLDLRANRFFSQEFFSLVKQRLNYNGLIALWLPGSLTYLSPELRDVNFSVINSLNSVFGASRVIPGDYNIVLAANTPGFSSELSALENVSVEDLIQRLNARNIQTNILLADYLRYRLNSQWSEWFADASKHHTREINRSLRPLTMLAMLIYWNKQFSPRAAFMLKIAQRINLTLILIAILLLTVGLYYKFRKKTQQHAGAIISYAIATTGFFGMFANLILVFAFQVARGYIYQEIGLLIAIFMSGTAIGSLLIVKITKAKNNLSGYFLKIESGIILYLILIALAVYLLGQNIPLWLFFFLFALSGALLGAEFPLAAKILSLDNRKVGHVAGLLYAADLAGGWVAGMLTGIVLLPVLGLISSCIAVAVLKLSSIFLIVRSVIASEQQREKQSSF